MGIRDEKILIFDGACGTNIQKMQLPASVWNNKYTGFNEYLNLSSPEAIVELHTMFLEAGSNVLETNTFGANTIVAAEYGLENDIEKLNHAAVANAKSAIADRPNCYIAGSIGPSTKLPSLGHIGVNEMAAAYTTQIRALVEAGVDCLIIETCQDLLQLKTILIAVIDTLNALGRDLPVMTSVTMEDSGTMLTGATIDAVISTLEPFPCFSLGLNCATGPGEMEPHVARLSRRWPNRISTIPNAGIPEVRDGQMVYPLSPTDFAAKIAFFVENYGVSMVGGCCGTSPDHIRALTKRLTHVTPSRPKPEYRPSLSSLYSTMDATQEIPPTMIGERMNANGSKKFRNHLLADNFDGAVQIGVTQEANGAHLLDLNCSYTGRDEKADFRELISRLVTAVKCPIVIDSTTPESVQVALENLPGRSVINSINLEDGGKNLGRICRLAKKHGAAVVALTIGPDGMAMTVEDKLAVAKDIHHLAVDTYGLRPTDIFFDLLTFTIGSGDTKLTGAAIETLHAISRVKQELPGVLTLLGVSNISFGLPRSSRKVLNSIFLHEAIEAGLDAAIVDPAKIVPVASIPENERKLCLDLIYNHRNEPDEDPLDAFLAYFKTSKAKSADKEKETAHIAEEEQLERMMQRGDKENLEDVIAVLLDRYAPMEIINQILVPAMRRIGDLMGRGEMLLPFVLKAAEVMKRSVDYLEPHMDQAQGKDKLKILLATVQGDVHDIGKNLVDIILANNGFEVINIGINVPTETVVKEAKNHNVDAIGLSGLLVKSAIAMQEGLPLLRDSGIDVPVLLGGAALTPSFVSESCAPGYPAPVVYCQDAFDGLKSMQALENGTLKGTALPSIKGVRTETQTPGPTEISTDQSIVPKAPFLGVRYVEEVDVTNLFRLINKQALFRGRWGYKQAGATKEEYSQLIRDKVEPIFSTLTKSAVEHELMIPKVAYGYFPCFKDGNSLAVEADGLIQRFDFPRQSFGSNLCIADYFKTEEQGGDIAGLFVVTLGPRIAEETKKLFQGDNYHDYLMLHGLAVETTEALAEHWHRKMRQELGVDSGTRYAFGYPACPNLDAQKPLFELLKPSKIGVVLTEKMEMVPEVSTSAIVVHHPKATYFSV
jgi:5-methyltetrahydrofolate--homocysteine methyltransferase